eukprot:2969644-Pleurochrysis_carterae.AAC.4
MAALRVALRLSNQPRTPAYIRVVTLARRAASHGPKGYGSGPYRGFEPPHVEPWKTQYAEFLGTITWLWFFWRAKHDGPVLLVRTRLQSILT